MTQLLVQDDAYRHQRAKTHWYKDDDRNNKFLHVSTTIRNKINRITSLEDDHGNRVSEN